MLTFLPQFFLALLATPTKDLCSDFLHFYDKYQDFMRKIFFQNFGPGFSPPYEAAAENVYLITFRIFLPSSL